MPPVQTLHYSNYFLRCFLLLLFLLLLSEIIQPLKIISKLIEFKLYDMKFTTLEIK